MIATLLSAAVLLQTPQLPASVVPVINEGPTKVGDYDWMKRHQAVVEYLKANKVDLLLIGDSITHGWGGPPSQGAYNVPGQDMWDTYFAPRKAVNLGFGWDSTQHVLWRFANGELDNIKPKAAMIMIGTNNIGWTSSEDIATGVKAIVGEIRRRMPATQMLLLGIFPRDEKPDGKNRKQVNEVNQMISILGKTKHVTYIDIGLKFLAADGTFAKDISPDSVHLTRKGYEIWAKAVDPILTKLMK